MYLSRHIQSTKHIWGAQECMDSLFLHYWRDPPDLPQSFNRCREIFFISHALNCKNISLVMTQHNTLCYGVSNLSIKYFITLNFCNNSLIHTLCSMQGVRFQLVNHIQVSSHAPFWYPWQNGMDSIQDMHAVNTDASYYLQRYPEKCLQVSERQKK